MEFTMKLSDYDYYLPKELIAQQPEKNRGDARMMVLHKNTGRVEHCRFNEITKYLSKGDLLILNNTKVIPARLMGNRSSGASVELLLVEELGENNWKALVGSNARLVAGEEVCIENTITKVKLINRAEDGLWLVAFYRKDKVRELLWQVGRMPLPPYIKRNKNNTLSSLDRERYQTVFAKKEGAIAAPTAGLHFTEDIIEKIRNKGVEIEFVTLHVGVGTFLPIKTEDILEHYMHKEYYEYHKDLILKIEKVRELNKRVIAVGSTTCRVLETIAMKGNTLFYSGWTDLFIYPPYNFKYVDALITNFHLPRTTLLLLVSAFAGRENILKAYEVARDKGYRFFSYGDCMIIL